MKVNWEGSVWSTFDRSGCLLMDLSKSRRWLRLGAPGVPQLEY
jgi:hypothetical protein